MAVAVVLARGRYDLSQLSDGEVLAGTRRLTGASNQLFADLLAHLAEVETRGIHRAKACASLYTYCIYELRFSEDAAFRRVSAARFVKAFPALFDAVASGELHLTGLLMLGPHLTASNQREVLARAKHRTKKELAKLVRELDPLPDVPPRIAPLGPVAEPRTALRNPTWAEYVASMVPVRHLSEGERPREWIDESAIARALEQSAVASNDDAPARVVNDAPARVVNDDGEGDNAAERAKTEVSDGDDDAPARVVAAEERHDDAPARVVAAEERHDDAPARVVAAIAGAQRYSVQFTAAQEYVDLVERAKALLSNARQGASLEELHLRAMQCLVAELEKKKYGAPRQESSAGLRSVAPTNERLQPALARESDGASAVPKSGEEGGDSGIEAEVSDQAEVSDERHRSRHVPARIRRRVFERDRARCTFTDELGCRCHEVDWLELHHLKPFARDGHHHADNLTLRCQAHNALAAEQDFGRELVVEKRGAARHESLRVEQPAAVTRSG